MRDRIEELLKSFGKDFGWCEFLPVNDLCLDRFMGIQQCRRTTGEFIAPFMRSGEVPKKSAEEFLLLWREMFEEGDLTETIGILQVAQRGSAINSDNILADLLKSWKENIKSRDKPEISIPISGTLCRNDLEELTQTLKGFINSEIAPGEDSITDYFLSELIKVSPDIKAVRFNRRYQEPETGADFELWIMLGNDGGFRFRVQAKKLNEKSENRRGLRRRIGRLKIKQIDRLICSSKKVGAITSVQNRD